MSDLVTVASFNTDYEAHLMRTFLQSEDIPAFVQGTFDPYSVIYPTNQFRVQIKDSDQERVREVLARPHAPYEKEIGFDACPECESDDVVNRTLHPKSVYALAFVFAPLLLLVGLRRNQMHCNSCSHQWRIWSSSTSR